MDLTERGLIHSKQFMDLTERRDSSNTNKQDKGNLFQSKLFMDLTKMDTQNEFKYLPII